MARTNHRLTRLVAPVVLALVAAGCSADTSEDEDLGELASSADAITGDELSAGAGWEGHDDLTPEEEAALDDEGGPDDDVDVASYESFSGGLRPLAGGCAAATGYTKGKATKICTTVINGKAVEVKTAEAYAKMRAAAKKAGVSLAVVSGFRTMAKQRELYNLYKAGRGNLAAPPGFSNHQSGHALDLNAKAPGVYKWLTANGAKFGFRRTVPSENWHWEHW